MAEIRPISDLRNHFADISRTVKERKEPVILTKNGYGDMVVFSYEQYQAIQHDLMVQRELREAEIEAQTSTEFFSHEEVAGSIYSMIEEYEREHVQDSISKIS